MTKYIVISESQMNSLGRNKGLLKNNCVLAAKNEGSFGIVASKKLRLKGLDPAMCTA